MPLSRDHVSLWAHAAHPVACPLSDASVDAWVERLDVSAGDHVVDLGCGLGAWAGRIASREPDAVVSGIDVSAVALDAARRLWPQASVDWVQADAAAWVEERAEPVDIFLCSGSTHALGGYRDTLARLAPRLRQGGLLLVGEGFWAQTPKAAALDALHAKPHDFLTLDDTLRLARGLGYDVVHAAASSGDEWDAYEAAWSGSLEERARGAPDLTNEDAERLLEIAQTHRAAYENGYRGTLGYVTLLLGRPAGQP